MTFKKLLAVLLCAALIFSLSACQGETAPDPEGDEQISLIDMIGREVLITPGSYENVVCVGAGALRMYCYVGDTDLLCGVEDIDNESLETRPAVFDSVARPYMLAYGESFTALPSCGQGGPMAQTAEAEKILSCNPDIVISEFEDADKAAALQEQLGKDIPVVTLSMGKDGVFDEKFAKSLGLLGKIFGKEDRAAELIDFINSERAEIEEAVKDISLEDAPMVYICGLGNWGTANHLTSSSGYAPFRIAKVNNVTDSMSFVGNVVLEEEIFVSQGKFTDVIILDAAAVKNLKPLLADDPTLFDSYKAWQNGEVYLEMAYNAYYTNYEIALINTWFVAKCVYPDLFGDLDMTEKTNEITEKFLGKALAEEIFACPSSFGGYQKIDVATFFK